LAQGLCSRLLTCAPYLSLTAVMLSHLSGSSARPVHARPVAQRTAGSLSKPSSQHHAVHHHHGHAAATRPAGGSLSRPTASRPTGVAMSHAYAGSHPTGVAMSHAYAESRPTGVAMSHAYAEPRPTGVAMSHAYAQHTAPGGMNLLRPAGPRANPNNLLAGGRVIEERVVDINELLAAGRLIEAPIERGQAFRPSAPMMSGLVAAPVATTAVMTAPAYGNVEYITEAPAYGNVEYIPEAVDGGFTEFVDAPAEYTTVPVTEVFVQ